MSEPGFLTVAQVERLHEELTNRFGGSHGLRDRLLFEAAVIQSRFKIADLACEQRRLSIAWRASCRIN